MNSRSAWIPALLLSLLVDSGWAATQVSTEQLQLSFGEQGQLLSAQVCHSACSPGSERNLRLEHPQGLIYFASPEENSWELTEDSNDHEHILTYRGPDGALLRWMIAKSGYGIALETRGLGQVTLQAGQDFRAREAPGFGEWLEQVRYLSLGPGKVMQISLDDGDISQINAEWAGFRSRFWTVLLTADESPSYSIQNSALNLDPVLVSQNAAENMNWQLYLGPVERAALAEVDELLPDLMYAGLWFWLRWICIFLGMLLGWIQLLVTTWGPAIMLLSMCVAIMMLPLSRLADRMQQQVNRTEAHLAPELNRLKREFKGEQQATRILELYKSKGIHPLYSLKSLLGVAIVIPVFIGAFEMLAENIHLMNTPFLWIEDLSRPDEFFYMPFELPFFGSGFNLLPWLMTGLSIWASWLHQPLALQAELRRRQVRNMILLAAAFFVLFYTFPAGMVLYWATNNLISVIKSLGANWLTRRVRAAL